MLMMIGLKPLLPTLPVITGAGNVLLAEQASAVAEALQQAMWGVTGTLVEVAGRELGIVNVSRPLRSAGYGLR